MYTRPLVRIHLLMLLSLLAAVAGCRRGSHLAEAQAPLFENFAVEVELDTVSVQFEVSDPQERDWQAWIYFSDDLGTQWQQITPVREGENQIPLSPPFESASSEWSYRDDLTSLPQADILVEVRLLDTTGIEQASEQSDALSIGNSNPPLVDSVTVPSGPVGGPIPLSATIWDADGDHVTISVDWSLTGSDPWIPATLEDVETDLVVPVDSEGTALEVTWLSHIDTPGVISPFARLRISAEDASGQGQATSLPIALNTIPPQMESVTIGAIPWFMNGSVPYLTDSGAEIPFIVSIPDRGSRLSVSWTSGLGGATPDSSTISIGANQEVAGRVPGTELADLFTVTGNTAHWKVPADSPLPLGSMMVSASIADVNGNPAPEMQYLFQVTPGSASARPFDWHDRWNLNFDRDNFTITIEVDSQGNISPNAVANSDGQPDHRQDLVTVGLQSDQPLPSASAVGANNTVKAWVEEAIFDRVRAYFGEGSQPDGSHLQPQLSFQSTTSNATSFIGIGGDDLQTSSYALGRASFDFRNSTANDERSPQRGVFTSNVVQFYWNSWTFRNRFAGVLPGLGTPVGEDVLDATVLTSGFERLNPINSSSQNARYDEIWLAIDAWSRIVAVIACHEIGHGVGLCANNHPPTGLFGGVDEADFVGPFTTPYHVDTPGLNIMASALGLTSALVEGESGYDFNELNRAYLAEWITLEP
ncbi:MAG: hypothetical protein AAEJ47_01800 [Planctomycetota bacterium]